MNTFRIPIALEYVSMFPWGEEEESVSLDPRYHYIKRLDSVIRDLTSKRYYVILDLHNYMRYNKQNVTLDVVNVDPNGTDVITADRMTGLWLNITRRYGSQYMIFGLMNEPHDVFQDALTQYTMAALDGLVSSRLTLLSGNYWTGLHSWFDHVNDTLSHLTNAEYIIVQFPQVVNSSSYAIEVHQYFDQDSSGRYESGDCIPFDNFTQQFDIYWALFENWTRKNKLQIYVGEFGAPDTPTCRRILDYFLGELTQFAYNETTRSGVIGWAIWAAGNSWGQYPISVSPGGRANSLMWNNAVYEKYLDARPEPFQPFATLTKAIQIYNNGNATLSFGSGYIPFQYEGTPDIPPGGVGYLYSNNVNNTPIGGLRVSYYTTNNTVVLGFGFSVPDRLNKSYAYQYNNIRGLRITNYSIGCPIGSPNGINAGGVDEPRCFNVTLQ